MSCLAGDALIDLLLNVDIEQLQAIRQPMIEQFFTDYERNLIEKRNMFTGIMDINRSFKITKTLKEVSIKDDEIIL